MAATLDPTPFRVRKYNGTPTTAATLKKISWRLVKFSATLVLTCVRSFGTGTYAIIVFLVFLSNVHPNVHNEALNEALDDALVSIKD